MIASRYKIQKNQFPTVLRGKSIQGNLFKVIITQNTQQETRIGVVIAKKYTKNAVLRNFLKRSVFINIQPFISQLPKKNIIFLMIRPCEKKAKDISQKNYRKNIHKEVSREIAHLVRQIII
jgi:ribonuclease P protein component